MIVAEKRKVGRPKVETVADPRAERTELRRRLKAMIKVEKGKDPCWHWTGKTTGKKTLCPVIVVKKRVLSARPLAWELLGKRKPAGPFKMHVTCKDSLCVNPDHLQVSAVRKSTGAYHPPEKKSKKVS